MRKKGSECPLSIGRGREAMLFFSLTSQERQLLEEFVARTVLSNEARRAQALLWLDAGESSQAIAERLRASRQTVYNWATRFRQRRNESDICLRLADGKRSGRPSTRTLRIDPLLNKTLDRSPRQFGYNTDRWTITLLLRHFAEAHGLVTNRAHITGALQRLGKTRQSLHVFVEELDVDGVIG
jgi:transposase